MSTSKDLIGELLSQGYSYAAIGRQVGRDGSLIRQIDTGTKPGHNLQESLTQLTTTGEVTTPPFRRTTSAGTIARVRGTRGAEAVIPTPPVGQRIRTVTHSTAQPRSLLSCVSVRVALSGFDQTTRDCGLNGVSGPTR